MSKQIRFQNQDSPDDPDGDEASYAAASSDPEVKEGEIVDIPGKKKRWRRFLDRLPRIRKKEKGTPR